MLYFFEPNERWHCFFLIFCNHNLFVQNRAVKQVNDSVFFSFFFLSNQFLTDNAFVSFQRIYQPVHEVLMCRRQIRPSYARCLQTNAPRRKPRGRSNFFPCSECLSSVTGKLIRPSQSLFRSRYLVDLDSSVRCVSSSNNSHKIEVRVV